MQTQPGDSDLLGYGQGPAIAALGYHPARQSLRDATGHIVFENSELGVNE